QDSSMADYDSEIANGASVNTFTVAASEATLTFSKASGLSTVLINGENRLYGFNATASGGNAYLNQVAFTVDSSEGLSLSNFKLYRGSTLLESDKVQISHNGNQVIATFHDPGLPEVITNGASQVYYLDAEVNQAITDSFVSTNLLESEIAADALQSGFPTESHKLTYH
ncbi:MAG: hypothetical protein V3R49_01505, partial [Gammaproteobacteria bacterium]